jgi:hypothetical protein
MSEWDVVSEESSWKVVGESPSVKASSQWSVVSEEPISRPGMTMPNIEIKPLSGKRSTDYLKEGLKEDIKSIPSVVGNVIKRATIPTVGAVGGGILGAGAGGVGAVPGAAVGGALGEWLQQIYEKYVLNEPDPSMKERAMRMITSAAAGAAGPELAALKFPQAASAMKVESMIAPSVGKAGKVGAREGGVPFREEGVVKALPPKGGTYEPPTEMGIPGSEPSMAVGSGIKRIDEVPLVTPRNEKGGTIIYNRSGENARVEPNIKEADIVSSPGIMRPSKETLKLNTPEKTPTIEEQIGKIADDSKELPSLAGRDIPGNRAVAFSNLRATDEFLNKAGYPELTAPVYKATSVGDGFISEMTDKMKPILKGTNAKTQAAIIRVREGRGTMEDLAIPGVKQKADQLGKWFDELFKVVDDPELKAALEKDSWKYLEGYVPMLKRQYGKIAEGGEQGAAEMLGATERAVGITHDTSASGQITKFLRKRKGDISDEMRELNLKKLMTVYLQGIRKTAFDIPAYQEAMGMLKTLPKDEEFTKQAAWYLNNWIGQPSAIQNTIGMNTAKWIRNRMYTALIGAKAPIAEINLTQSGFTGVETGFGRTAKSWLKSFTPSAQRGAERSGYFREYPGTEGSVRGVLDRASNVLMEGAERINRTTSREAGLAQSAEKGLKRANLSGVVPGSRKYYLEKFGNESSMNAWNVTRKTQFMYGKESPIRWATNHPLLSMFTSYPTKAMEYHHGVIKDALTKGGTENWAKVARLFAVDAVMGVGLSQAPAAISNVTSVSAGPIIKFGTQLSNSAKAYMNGKKDELETFIDLFKTGWRFLMPGGDATVRLLEDKKK